MHQGAPLVFIPGANVFYTNKDLSTPPDHEGNRLISCHRVTAAETILQMFKAGRLLSKLGL